MPGPFVRYQVKNLEIRSENAAQPMSHASNPLLAWISAQKATANALDYGCGKLRYSGALANKCHRLTLVDSHIQIDRTQKIGDEITTVRNYAARHFPRVRVLSVDEFETDQQQYGLALCANVLSAIPLATFRSHVLRRLVRSLKPTGTCLFATQYRNSYFKEVTASPNATPNLDGWILKSSRGNYYYGILDKLKLENLVKRHGFNVVRSWTDGQSAYVVAAPLN